MIYSITADLMVSLFLLDRTLNAQTLAASVRNFSVMSVDLIVAFGER